MAKVVRRLAVGLVGCTALAGLYGYVKPTQPDAAGALPSLRQPEPAYPAPTLSLATAVPFPPASPQAPASGPYPLPPATTELPPHPTVDPDESYIMRGYAEPSMARPGDLVGRSSVVIRGRVARVGAAAWSTIDGSRPRNPRAGDAVIYKPVDVQVTEILKGTAVSSTIKLFSPGGVVGKDETHISPSTMSIFAEGENVILFLEPHLTGAVGDKGLFDIYDRYTVSSDKNGAIQATNGVHTFTLDEILTEIYNNNH